MTENGAPRPVPAGSRMTLWFTADGRLVASGGCNLISGRVELSGGRVTLTEARMTEAACADDLMAQDEWLAALLHARPWWQLSGPHLRVSSGGTVVELTDRRVLHPDRPLEGTRWAGSELTLSGVDADGSGVGLCLTAVSAS